VSGVLKSFGGPRDSIRGGSPPEGLRENLVPEFDELAHKDFRESPGQSNQRFY
jgi:hypothetical protein